MKFIKLKNRGEIIEDVLAESINYIRERTEATVCLAEFDKESATEIHTVVDGVRYVVQVLFDSRGKIVPTKRAIVNWINQQEYDRCGDDYDPPKAS